MNPDKHPVKNLREEDFSISRSKREMIEESTVEELRVLRDFIDEEISRRPRES
jgi:hypothetical protein